MKNGTATKTKKPARHGDLHRVCSGYPEMSSHLVDEAASASFAVICSASHPTRPSSGPREANLGVAVSSLRRVFIVVSTEKCSACRSPCSSQWQGQDEFRLLERLSQVRGVWTLRAWLGRQDSNLGMPVPKTGALPLGDAPMPVPACGFGVARGRSERRETCVCGRALSKKRAARQRIIADYCVLCRRAARKGFRAGEIVYKGA